MIFEKHNVLKLELKAVVEMIGRGQGTARREDNQLRYGLVMTLIPWCKSLVCPVGLCCGNDFFWLLQYATKLTRTTREGGVRENFDSSLAYENGNTTRAPGRPATNSSDQ